VASYQQSRFLRLTVVALVALGLSSPALSFSPSKEHYEKCYALTSLPKHFTNSPVVLAADFKNTTEDEMIGSYTVRHVWKGSLKKGDRFQFDLSRYDHTDLVVARNDLMKPGTTYLFLVKPLNGAKANAEAVYEAASCFPFRGIGEREWIDAGPYSVVPVLNELAK
jgi:hypothetical protein